jgi:hypothetical protein
MAYHSLAASSFRVSVLAYGVTSPLLQRPLGTLCRPLSAFTSDFESEIGSSTLQLTEELAKLNRSCML